jgi:hypothetical protein
MKQRPLACAPLWPAMAVFEWWCGDPLDGQCLRHMPVGWDTGVRRTEGEREINRRGNREVLFIIHCSANGQDGSRACVCVCLSESSGKRHRKALDGLPEDGDQATKRIVLVYKVLVTGFDCLTGGHMFCFVNFIICADRQLEKRGGDRMPCA